MPDFDSESERRGLIAARGDPDRLVRVVHRAIEEVLGGTGFVALSFAFPRPSTAVRRQPVETQTVWPAHSSSIGSIDQVLSALEVVYGQQGGRGLAYLIGQACLRHGIRDYGEEAGVYGSEFQMQPLPRRLRAGLQSFARVLNKGGQNHVVLQEEDRSMVWRVESCPLCRGRRSSQPICYLAIGVLQEALNWLSGGRNFRVEEVACLSRGDGSCRFLIDPTPIAD